MTAPARRTPRSDRYPRAGADQVNGAPGLSRAGTRGPGLLGQGPDLPGIGRRRPAGENGANEYVFYDGPPFANGLPHYGHLLTGYVKDVVPRYQTMRGRRVERRFGWDTHGLPAEVEAERQLGIKHKSEIVGDGHRGVQRRLPGVGAALHPRVGGLRHPAGPLGRLRQRLQDPRSGLHGVRHVGVQDAVGQGADLRGLPGALVLHAVRDPAVGHRDQDGRHLPVPAGPGRHGVARGCAPGDPRAGRRQRAGLDDHPVDPAVQPGARRRTRTSTTWSSSRPDPFAGRYLLAAARVSRLRARTRRGAAGAGHVHRQRSWPAPGTRRRSTSSSGRTQQAPHQDRSTADYVTTEDGTGVVHIAPAFGEEDKAVTDAAGIEVVNPVDAQGKFTSQVPPYEGYHVFDANIPIMADLKEAGLLLRRDSYEHSVPALLALRHPADPAGGVVLVRRGDQVPGPDGRAEPADHLGAGAHQGRPVRQVAGGRPGLVDLPEPVLGLADPGLDLRRPGVPADRRLRLARRARARLRRAPGRPAPAVHRRADQAEPGRPDRPVDHAPGARGAGLLVRIRLDAVRPGALPVREPEWFDGTSRLCEQEATTRATSSSSTTARPAAGSTPCTCWPPRCSTGRRSSPAWRTASCSATTGRRCPSRGGTTRTSGRSSSATAPTRCAGS